MAKKACAYPDYWQPLCILQPSTLVSSLNMHTQNTAIYHDCMCMLILLLYHHWMWKHRLQPPTLVSILYVHTQIAAMHSHSITVWCTLRLEASTLLSLLNVHPWITTIHSCNTTVCAHSDYNHPILYHYSICTDYRHILFYHYCMCTLRLQPSTLLSIMYVHPWTTAIHSCITVFAQATGTYCFIITVCAPSDYSHLLS
jgi:hypothetical protein